MIVEPGRPEGPLTVSDIQAQSVLLSWKPPQDDGGGKIEGYLIEAKDVLHLDIHKRYIWVEGQNTECQVDGLVTSHIYQFRVCAQNEVGRGDALLLKTPVRIKAPSKKPITPSKPTAKIVEDNAVLLQWSVPTDNEDLNFLVERRDINSNLWIQCNHDVLKKMDFLITELREDTEYLFRVSSENAHGLSLPSEESNVIQLNKHIGTPPKIIIPLKNCLVKINEDACFSCEYTGTPPIQANWSKDGIRICEGFRATIRTEKDQRSCLTLEEVDSDDDESTIQCNLRNVEGKASTEAKIKVLNPPKLTAPASYRDGLSFDPGESLRIKFHLSGKPTPNVKWYFNESEGSVDERASFSLNPDAVELRVCELTSKDSGQYNFFASNDVGSDEIDVLVTVNGPPDPPSVEKLSTENADGDVKLKWDAPEYEGGSSVFNYIIEKRLDDEQNWLRLGTTFDRFFTFISEDGFEGFFRLKAVNVYGTSEPSKEFQLKLCRPVEQNEIIVQPLHSSCGEKLCIESVSDNENQTNYNNQTNVAVGNDIEGHESDKKACSEQKKFKDSQDIPLNVLFVATQTSLHTTFLNYACISSVPFYQAALFAVEVPVQYKITEKDIERNNCYLIRVEITEIDQLTGFKMENVISYCIQPLVVKQMCLEIFEPFSEIAHYISEENGIWYREILLCGTNCENTCRMRGISSIKRLNCIITTMQYERCVPISFLVTHEIAGLQKFEEHSSQYALIILDYCEAVVVNEVCCLNQVVDIKSLTAATEYETEHFTTELIENKIDQRCCPLTTCKPAMSVLPVRKNSRLQIDSLYSPPEVSVNRFDDFDERNLSLQLLEIEKSILDERRDVLEQTVSDIQIIPLPSSERYAYSSTDLYSTTEKDHSSKEISHCNGSKNYNQIEETRNISTEEFNSTRWRKHSDLNNKTELTVKVPPWLRNVSPIFSPHDSVLNENTSGNENEIVIDEKKYIQGDVCKYEVRGKSVRELLNLAEEVERRFSEKTEQIESLENLLQSELTSLESDLAVVSEIHRSLRDEPDILLPVDLLSDKYTSMTIESEKNEEDLIDFNKAVECTEVKESNQEEYAPEIITHLQNRVVQSGNRTRLYCSISGKPDPQVVWLKNGKLLPKSTRHIFNNLMEFGFYIDIYNAMSSDSGMYTCIATNCHGVAQTRAYLRVMGKREFSPEEPKFLKSPSDIKVNAGDTVTLEWKISGTPVPNVIWFKNAEKIETNLKLDAFSNHRGCCRLVLHDVTADDCAIYSCYVENEAGSSVSTVLVSVSDGANESATIRDNSDVVLNVKEKCYILDDLDLSLLDLEERLRKEALLFESMPFKRTMSEEPKGAPFLPGRPFAPTTVSVGGSWAILSWTVPLDYRERDSTLIYRVEKRRLTSSRWKEVGRTKNTVYTVHGLKSGKSYAFRISASNREGWGPAATLPHPVHCNA